MESKGFSPSYREARDTFKNMSKPDQRNGDRWRTCYDEARARIAGQVTDADKPTKLLNAERARRGSAAPFPDIERVFAPESRPSSNAVLQDMQRASKAEGMGKPSGSPTAQYLTTQNLMRQT
jgi:hypothetical protein